MLTKRFGLAAIGGQALILYRLYRMTKEGQQKRLSNQIKDMITNSHLSVKMDGDFILEIK